MTSAPKTPPKIEPTNLGSTTTVNLGIFLVLLSSVVGGVLWAGTALGKFESIEAAVKENTIAIKDLMRLMSENHREVGILTVVIEQQGKDLVDLKKRVHALEKGQ